MADAPAPHVRRSSLDLGQANISPIPRETVARSQQLCRWREA